MNESMFLYNNIKSDLSSIFKTNEANKINKITQYIDDNLVLNFRRYQRQAMSYGIYAIKHGHHNLMFNMATGSGKTDLMAGLMLYMFNYYGIHDFLYTISKSAVVNQSRRALSDSSSNKYLFHQSLRDKNGSPIIIRPCADFPIHPQKDTIYICCIDIQSLRSRVFSPRENDVSLENLGQNPLVIFGDEAHHYNATTLNKHSKASREDKSWENTLNIIHDQCYNNHHICYQFDFTATLALTNPDIRRKYAPIMAYRYRLGDFINDGYSKTIEIVHSTDHSKDKMLAAVLINQFRKIVARRDLDSHYQDFKPVLMFKSPTKKASKKNEQIFLNLIQNLTLNQIQHFVSNKLSALESTGLSPLLTDVFMDWDNLLSNSSIEDLSATVQELKDDFSDYHNIVNLNSKKDFDSGKWKYLDNLDMPGNPCRVVFEVQKVDEGWDVHNLFDIVRLNNKTASMSYTLKEAQLIGRGARYYSFPTEDRFNKYKRCYDGASYDIKYKMLETLFYYTIDQPLYNKRLAEALKKTNTIYNSDSSETKLSANITRDFKNSPVYQYGLLYTNTPKHRKRNEYTSLQKFNIRPDNQLFTVTLIHQTSSESYSSMRNLGGQHIAWTDDDTFDFMKHKHFIRDLMHSIDFYHYQNLNYYVPIKSVNQFINQYLQGYHLHLRSNYDYGINDILIAFKRVLIRLASQIRTNAKKPVGTKTFTPIRVKTMINDYQRRAPINAFHKPNKQIIGLKPMNIRNNKDLKYFYQKSQDVGIYEYATMSRHLVLKQHPWFAFNFEIGNGLERRFVTDVGSVIKRIQRQYHPKFIYLLRNDEKAGHQGLYDIPRKNHEDPYLDRYMPDFILYISHSDNFLATYELYLEPKGTGFIAGGTPLNVRDAWKEKLLEFIRPDNINVNNHPVVNQKPYSKYLGSIDNVSLYGIRFYEYREHGTNWSAVKHEIMQKINEKS